MLIQCDKELLPILANELKQYEISENGQPLRITITSGSGQIAATRQPIMDFTDIDGIVVFSATPLVPQTSRLILVGISKMTTEGSENIRQTQATVFLMHEIMSEGIHNVCDAVMAKTRECQQAALVVDMSVVEEPGGMSVRELLYFIHRLAHTKKITTAEVTRISDGKAAAKIITEIAALLLLNSNERFK